MRLFRLFHWKFLLTLVIMLPLVGTATGALSWHGFTLREWWRETHSGEIVWNGSGRGRFIALTFDDGPDPNYTPRVLAILKRYGVHATFFQEGRCIEAYPEITRQVIAEGHLIGNHTYSHPYLERKRTEEVRNEITRCDRCLASAAHYRTHWFRAPRGRWSPAVYWEAQRDGERVVEWTVALEHHDAKTPKAMADRVLRIIRPGGIILMHDGAFMSRETTVQALPLLLEGLKRRGYRCVTVAELLHEAR